MSTTPESRLAPGSRCGSRATAYPTVADESDATFTVLSGSGRYYVNDAATTGDVYCSAAGSDSNDGLTPATPKASLQAVLDGYALTAGSTVYLDTGTYNLASDVTLGSSDGGSTAGNVQLLGSPNGSVLNRLSASGTSLVVSANYVTVQGLRCTGGSGISVTGQYGIVRSCVCVGPGSSGTGINLAGAYGQVLNSICSGHGLGINLGSYCLGQSNAVYSGGNGVSTSSYAARSTSFMGNIVRATGSGKYCLYDCNLVLGSSDYNLLVAEGGAIVGQRLSTGFDPSLYATLADWRTGTGYDSHSLCAAPLFADAPAGDLHLQSTGGRWNPSAGTWVVDAADSPGLDAGDPDSAVGDEPVPNGGRRNLGAYGGTIEASRSPAGRRLWLLAPAANQTLSGQVSVRWQAAGQAWAAGDTLRAEFSSDSGATWNAIAGATALPWSRRQFSWPTTVVANGTAYRLRLVCNQDGAVLADTGGDLAVRNVGAALAYYVNDASVANDVYCTAVGSAANDGLSPATPKASVQAVLDIYDLEPGDTVFIDTGNYLLTSNLTVAGNDSGSARGMVRLCGSTGRSGTVIDRGSSASGAAAIALDDPADYVCLENLQLTGGQDGLLVSCHARTYELRSCALYGNARYGLYSPTDHNSSTPPSLLLTGCRVYGNASGGVTATPASSTLTVERCSFSGNGGTALKGALSVRNTIIAASGSSACCLEPHVLSSFQYDWNDLLPTGGARIAWNAAGLAEWRSVNGQDVHSLSVDPLFAVAAAGDFHLKSTGGRWQASSGSWTTDAVDSPCLDAGCPSDAVGDEPAPNGGRLNLGAYGGGGEASRSATGRRLALLAPLPGQFVQGSCTIDWLAAGQAWQPGDTVKLQYSLDAGSTWSDLPAGEARPFTEGTFTWNTAAVPSGARRRVRLVCNQDAATTATSGDFTVHNSGLAYYVNDASTTNDVYCMGAGSSGNDGLTPATPKASLLAILDAYALGPGDTVYVDTGTYVLTADTVVTAWDDGSPTGSVTIQGSPKGAVLNRNSTAYGAYALYLDYCDYVRVQGLCLTGGYGGLKISGSGERSGAHLITGNRVYGNATYGIVLSTSCTTTVRNNVICNNGCGVYLHSWGNQTLHRQHDLRLRRCRLQQQQRRSEPAQQHHCRPRRVITHCPHPSHGLRLQLLPARWRAGRPLHLAGRRPGAPQLLA